MHFRSFESADTQQNKLLQTVTEHEMWFAKINQTHNKYLSTYYKVISRFEQIFQKYRKLKFIISLRVIEEKKAKQNSQSICLRSYKANNNMLCGFCSLPGVPVGVVSIRTMPSDLDDWIFHTPRSLCAGIYSYGDLTQTTPYLDKHEK